MKTQLVQLGFCLFILCGLAFSKQTHLGGYLITRDPNDRLVISNQKPPPGHRVIGQRSLPDAVSETPPLNDSKDKQSNDSTEYSNVQNGERPWNRISRSESWATA